MKTSKHIGMNGLAQALRQIFSSKSAEDSFVSKTYEGTEDSFFDEANASIRSALNLENESYESDLKRFGTRITLIDVGDDAIVNRRRKSILPLPKKVRPATEGFTDTYEDDLKRFGTTPGIIDVSNDRNKNKKASRPSQHAIENAYQTMMSKWNIREPLPFSVNPFSDIFREFPKLQITVHNPSSSEEEVTLWGGNQQTSTGSYSSGGTMTHMQLGAITVSEGIYPQNLVVNPFNHYVYVVNQLSGSVTVINESFEVVTIITLDIILPVFISPIALTVNTKVSSVTYGYVYVVCSVSNKVVIIDTSLNVIGSLPTGVRPVAIAFNPVNLLLYIANLVSDNMTIIHAELLSELGISPLPTGADPTGVGVNPDNGDVYVTGSLDNDLAVYNVSNELVTLVPGMGQYPVTVAFNPANHTMYVVATNNNVVYQIDTTTYTVIASIATGIKPYAIFFNSSNSLLYVQNRVSNDFTLIRSDNTLVVDTPYVELNIGGIYNPFNNATYITDTLNNMIVVLQDTLITLVFNDDYISMRQDFQGNPGLVMHTKFVVTGQERINSFRHNRFTPTGLVKSKPISFELFASPQSLLNVSEVTALAGTIIDGKMNWKFKLPALHTVAILIWYRQFEVRDLLGQGQRPPYHKKGQRPSYNKNY